MMKLILPLLLISTLAVAAPKKKPKHRRPTQSAACKVIQADADEECNHQMCDDDIANGTWKDMNECTTADDFGEAASEGCADVLGEVTKEYNKKHHTNFNCEE